jgi:hypothetical protein
LVAETIFIARVICCVVSIDPIRLRMSRRFATSEESYSTVRLG